MNKIVHELKYFIIDFHQGSLNRICHLIGFTLFFAGLFYKNLLLIVMGALIQETGHFYNYYVLKDKKSNPYKSLLHQVVILTPIILALLYLFKWFNF